MGYNLGKSTVYLIVSLMLFLSLTSAGTLSTYRDVVETSVHELYADELSEGVYEMEADAYAGNAERNRIYAAYITDYSPDDYSNFSFHLDEQSNNNHNFHLTTYWLENGNLSDIGSGEYEKFEDFGQPPAEETYSTNLSDRDEDYGKVAVVVEGTHYWYEDDYLRVVVSDVSEPETDFTICDNRGPKNQCFVNSTHSLDSRDIDIPSIFEASPNSEISSIGPKSNITFTNTTRLSGLWTGSLNISVENDRNAIISAGARFDPSNGNIVIG